MVTLNGFELITTETITVKIFGSGLVIVPGTLPPFANRRTFCITNMCSTDPAFLQIVKTYCTQKETPFIEKNGVYYQSENFQLSK